MKKLKNPTNKEIAHLLESVSSALEIKGKNRFRIRAYDEAASAIAHSTVEAKDLWDDGKLQELSGIGESIANYLGELFETGKVKHFEKVFKGIPDSVFIFLKIPGIGPKSAVKLAEKLNIKARENALKRLEKAGKDEKIRVLEGFGEKSEKDILKGIKEFGRRSDRLLFPVAENIANDVVSYMNRCEKVEKIEVLGSLRRKCATVGDVDIAVASKKPKEVIDYFVKYPKKIRILGQGRTKASIVISGNYQIDLRVESREVWGSMLQYFTGSKEHNIRLRKIAQEKGYSLSEYGIKKHQNSKTPKLQKREDQTQKFDDEKKFYNYLGMEWIEPELREDRGEIDSSLANKLPDLVKLKDIKGDLQLHSSFDVEPSHDLGENTMEEMVKKAGKLDYEYIAFTEHNPSISKHNDEEIIDIIKKKKEKIDKINYSSRNNTQNNVYVFNSLEIDIRPNGELAFPDKGFEYLDFALVSIHSSFRQNKEKMTKRVLTALENEKVKILAHPTGRMLGKREAIEADWDKIFNYCVKNNKFLEINGHFKRMDLPDMMIKEAIEHGLRLSMGTDAHEEKGMENMKYAVNGARRGWAEKKDIINCLDCDRIREILEN